MKSIAKALSLSALLIACGSDDGGGELESTMITASEGGTVQVEGTETSLNIPADSLAEDTEVTVAMASIADYDELEGAIDLVVDLSPPTALSSSATLMIDTSEMNIAFDASLSIRQYIDGEWIRPELAGAELGSGGLVATSVSILAPTAVVVTNAVPQ